MVRGDLVVEKEAIFHCFCGFISNYIYRLKRSKNRLILLKHVCAIKYIKKKSKNRLILKVIINQPTLSSKKISNIR